MTAVSTIYLIWIFFTTLVFWMTPVKHRRLVLILSTIILLGNYSLASLLLLMAMSGSTCYVVQRNSNRLLAFLIVAITLCLLWIKLLQTLPGAESATIPIIFGISFYSLRVIHILLEHYFTRLGSMKTQDLLVYLFFPPIIAAGPIQRIDSFERLDNGIFNTRIFAKGLEKILHGCALIIIVHNVAIQTLLFPWLKKNILLTMKAPLQEWVACLEYGLSLYLQFSAYSTIAIGFALLLGYRLDENFNWPFLRTSLVTFWRNWHISLSSFCRVYIFNGTLAFSRSAPLAFIASMLAIGIWHSTSINFVLWGVYHGCGLIITQVWLSGRWYSKISKYLPSVVVSIAGWFITFNFVILGFAFTKHDTLSESMQSWARVLGLL